MRFNFPKDDAKYHWTQHCGRKMLFYGLSADRIKRVIRNPKRSEKGVAPDTIAVMQPAGTFRKPAEVWVMYALRQAQGKLSTNRKIIITAWRYPGISKIREAVPMPADIIRELKEEGIVVKLD